MSERGNRRVLYALSLAISLLIWFFVTVDHRGERRLEKAVEANVTYPPLAGLVILEPVERVRVRLLGRDEDLRAANRDSVYVRVELSGARQGPVDVHLLPDNVRMPKGLEVVSIEPEYLRLELDQEIRRLIPVKVQLEGEPAAGAVALNPVARPGEILVSGPTTLLRQIDHLKTSPVSLNGHALDFVESAMVISPDPLLKILSSPVVSVSVPMQQPLLPSEDSASASR